MYWKFFSYISLGLIVILADGCALHNSQNEGEAFVDPWDNYDKAANEATLNQQYDRAEEYHYKAIEEKKKCYASDEEMRKYPIGWHIKGDYLGLSQIYAAQGRCNEALAARMTHYRLHKDKMQIHEVFWYYGFLTEIYLAQGKFDDSQKAVEWIIENANKSMQDAEKTNNGVDLFNARSLKFWTALPTVGNYFTQTGNYEKAIQYLREHFDYTMNSTGLSKNKAIAANNLATAYYYSGNEQSAEQLFRDAAGLNPNGYAGFPEDLAKSLTMLGNLAVRHGEPDKALNFYRSALDALRGKKMHWGLYRVEQADVLIQIGRFYLKQGNPDESSKAYHEAVALRQATGTATHPNCADAIRGLADVAAFKGELTSATLQAEQALKILDASVVPTHPRTAATLVALSSIQLLSGKPEQSAPLQARLESILQKPLGPWKEDFMDTSAFYLKLLNKAGQTDAAKHLEQLQARQKDRR